MSRAEERTEELVELQIREIRRRMGFYCTNDDDLKAMRREERSDCIAAANAAFRQHDDCDRAHDGRAEAADRARAIANSRRW